MIKGNKHTLEARGRMRQSQLGRKHPQEVKNKIRIANTGRKFSSEHREKIRVSKLGNQFRLGKKHSQATIDKLRRANIGKKLSDITRQKMSKSHLRLHLKFSIEHKRKIGDALRGKPKSLEHRKNLGGNNHHNWKGGISSLNSLIRGLPESYRWKMGVFDRDDYICEDCKKRGGELEADHIDRFCDIIKRNGIKTVEQAISCKELWEIDNGRTLCKECHSKKTKNDRDLRRPD